MKLTVITPVLGLQIVTSTPEAVAEDPNGSPSRRLVEEVVHSTPRPLLSFERQKLYDWNMAQVQATVVVDRTPMLPGEPLSDQSAEPSEDSLLSIPAVQQSVQGAAAEAANAAGAALRSAAEVEQSFETMLTDTKDMVPSYDDVQQALGSALHAELGIDATNAFLGLGGVILALLGALSLQIQQRQESEAVCDELRWLCLTPLHSIILVRLCCRCAGAWGQDRITARCEVEVREQAEQS